MNDCLVQEPARVPPEDSIPFQGEVIFRLRRPYSPHSVIVSMDNDRAVKNDHRMRAPTKELVLGRTSTAQGHGVSYFVFESVCPDHRLASTDLNRPRTLPKRIFDQCGGRFAFWPTGFPVSSSPAARRSAGQVELFLMKCFSAEASSVSSKRFQTLPFGNRWSSSSPEIHSAESGRAISCRSNCRTVTLKYLRR